MIRGRKRRSWRRRCCYMRKEFRQRLAKEYRYAATKMLEASQPARKLFYFSVLHAEAQRILNWEWNRDLALIQILTNHAHSQINPTTQTPVFGTLLPIQGAIIYEKLSEVASGLASYFE